MHRVSRSIATFAATFYCHTAAEKNMYAVGAICPTISFMSTVVGHAATEQLNECLLTNDLMPRYQSAYRKKYSTETAFLRVSSYLSDTLNSAEVDKLLSSASWTSPQFDCVDHDLLLQRLEHGFGLADVLLRWIHSFLSERAQQVA